MSRKNYLKDLPDFPAEQATNINAKNANHLLIKCTSRQQSRCVNDKTPAKATSQPTSQSWADSIARVVSREKTRTWPQLLAESWAKIWLAAGEGGRDLANV